MKIYYLIGQPGSGKTEIGKYLCKFFGDNAIHIDGDDMRILFDNKDYSKQGRMDNIQRVHDIARFLSANFYTPIISLVSPYKDLRDEFKKNNDVIEIYLHTTEIRGKEHFHVKDYEVPTENFIDIDTTNKTVEQSFNEIGI